MPRDILKRQFCSINHLFFSRFDRKQYNIIDWKEIICSFKMFFLMFAVIYFLCSLFCCVFLNFTRNYSELIFKNGSRAWTWRRYPVWRGTGLLSRYWSSTEPWNQCCRHQEIENSRNKIIIKFIWSWHFANFTFFWALLQISSVFLSFTFNLCSIFVFFFLSPPNITRTLLVD